MTTTEAPPARRRLTIVKNTLGEVIPPAIDDRGDVRAAFPPGRLVVAAGQTIASVWGNTAFDQSVQCFANAADRAAQWPAPNEGAMSWLVDTHTPWVYRGGAWHGVPMGFLVFAQGPNVTTDTTTGTNLFGGLSFQAVTGRRYRATLYCNGTVITASGNPRAQVGSITGPIAMDNPPNTFFLYANTQPAGYIALGIGTFTFTATGTGTASLGVTASCAGTGSGYRIAAQGSWGVVEDIGS